MINVPSRNVRPLLLSLLLSLTILGLLISNQYWLSNVESDVLYLVSLYRDLFVDHYGLSGWNMPGALYLFPDATLLFPLLWAAPEIGYSYVAYSILLFFLMLAAVTAIAYNLNKDFFRSLLCASCGVLFLVSLSQDRDYASLLYLFFYPNYHSGPVLVGLVLTAIFMHVLERGYSRVSAIAFFLLSYLGILSEIIIIPQFLLPLILSVLIFNLLGLIHRRTLFVTVGLIEVAHLASWCTLKVLALTKVITLSDLYLGCSFDMHILLKCCATFLRNMKYYMQINGLLFGMLGIWLVVSLRLLLQSRHYLWDLKNSRAGNSDFRCRLLFLVVLSLVSLLGTVCAPIALNRWVGRFSMRYEHLLYIWPLFLLSITAASCKGKYVSWLKVALIGILCFGLSMILPGARELDRVKLRHPYPKRVKCFDEIAESYNLHYGYGNYWHARYLTVLSRRGVRVNQVQKDLALCRWFNNTTWYCATPGNVGRDYPKYDFILVTPSTRATVEEKFGRPSHKEHCYGIEVNIYDRESDIAFRNYLRLPVYIALGRELPSSPASPEVLGIYKPEGTPSEAPGNVSIPEDGKLAVRFDPPVANDIIEICADGDDEYLVHFFSREVLLGSLIVPATSKKNLQIRYLQLPECVDKKAFDRLEIQPTGGDQRYSIGHIFLYDDSYEVSPTKNSPSRQLTVRQGSIIRPGTL